MRHIHYVLFITFFLAACTPQDHLTILHTNDTHSQVEPNGNDQGGYARRMGLIAAERKADKNLLLVDAGDFCQGTPYFNFYHGRVEIDAMNKMHYDAVTLGNHEFDNGLDTLAAVLKTAQFPIVCANYDFTGTAMENITHAYTIIRKGGLKIGVFGLGCDPKGLIADKNFLPAKYIDPLPVAQAMADTLHAQGCDVVVCLSHLGTYGKSDEDMCDATLARKTRGIDVFVGGHTHKLYDNLRVANLDGDSVPLCQMGKSGIYLGKIMLSLSDKNEK